MLVLPDIRVSPPRLSSRFWHPHRTVVALSRAFRTVPPVSFERGTHRSVRRSPRASFAAWVVTCYPTGPPV